MDDAQNLRLHRCLACAGTGFLREDVKGESKVTRRLEPEEIYALVRAGGEWPPADEPLYGPVGTVRTAPDTLQDFPVRSRATPAASATHRAAPTPSVFPPEPVTMPDAGWVTRSLSKSRAKQWRFAVFALAVGMVIFAYYLGHLRVFP